MRRRTGAQNDQTPVQETCTTQSRDNSACNQYARRAGRGTNNGADLEYDNAPPENPLNS